MAIGVAICEAAGCCSLAEVKMFWPGNGPMDVCCQCAQSGAKMADILGFKLPFQPIHGFHVIERGKEEPIEFH